jgi:hypothetical protein
MSAVPPIMVKSPNNPDGLPISVFDGLGRIWPPIALSFIAISLPRCSTGLIDQAPSRWMVLLEIGGARG